MGLMNIEIVCATTEKQQLIALSLAQGCTLIEAVQQSHILDEFPELNLSELSFGIFGKLEMQPQQRILQAGDRVEIYRPLLLDPKEARRLRAERAKKEKVQDKRMKRVRTTDGH